MEGEKELQKRELLSMIGTGVIPCQINKQNGHPSQILLKLGEHIPYPK
jgi:hypothetical protein